jgi:diguanylate cyclase (GGDEF)-like protein/PAS domain S-box-containing protein
MAFVGLGEGELGRFLEVNRALCEITGYRPDELTRMTLQDISLSEHVADVVTMLLQLAAAEVGRYQLELRCSHASGQPVWVMVSASLVRDADGRPLHGLLQLQDIDGRKSLESQLEHLADHDPLTGLYNRRRFARELARQLAYARRYGGRGAVLMVDVDDLKRINDRFGHAVGDELIAGVAALLRERLRSTDVLGRMGGDEFAVLVPNTTVEAAEALAAELGRVVREESGHASAAVGSAAAVTASIGLAFFDADDELSGRDVLVAADHAMYAAKEGGRNRFASQSELGEGAGAMRLTWPGRIRRALEHDLFELHAQPVIDLQTGEVCQHELLIRLPGDDDELILPGAFLYTAERFGMAAELDRWVVANAAALLGGASDELRLEVNLSAESLGDAELPLFVEQQLSDAGIDPARLIFEVTETAAISNLAQARAFVQRLTGLGCGFALDDFGAGFGSFYYLKHLPLDYLKIDGEFVRNLPSSQIDQVLVASVVQIARGLGKQTIAEFVGDADTVDLLRALGVDYAQGFYTGRPLPVAQALIH